MENTGGDRVEGEIGDNAQQAAIGKDNQQASATGNVVNVYSAPVTSLPATGRRLSTEIELEFRQTFAKLTEALIELRESVKTNNTLTKQQIDLLQMQVDNVKKMAESAESKIIGTLSGVNIVAQSAQPILPRWAILLGATCLALMTFGIVILVYLVAQGAG